LPCAPKDSISGEEEMKTIDKSKLQSKYTFWSKGPNDKLNEIKSVDTIDEFWKAYKDLGHPKGVSDGTVFHVFNYGVKPVWEDSSLDKGMHLEMKIYKQ